MEEQILSLGNIMLWNDMLCNDDNLTNEMAELFVAKIFGAAVLKLQYGDVFYAVLPTKKSDIFKVQTQKGARYIRYENFDDLKEAIQEANK